MAMSNEERERSRKWRESEFVVSFSQAGGPDRGRMRGTSFNPPAILHRSRCALLSVERRAHAMNPSFVHATTPEQFASDRRSSSTEHKICKLCCSDLIKEGK